jgi:hypothetical protein
VVEWLKRPFSCSSKPSLSGIGVASDSCERLTSASSRRRAERAAADTPRSPDRRIDIEALSVTEGRR